MGRLLPFVIAACREGLQSDKAVIQICGDERWRSPHLASTWLVDGHYVCQPYQLSQL
jgi:hypothetical protein